MGGGSFCCADFCGEQRGGEAGGEDAVCEEEEAAEVREVRVEGVLVKEEVEGGFVD